MAQGTLFWHGTFMEDSPILSSGPCDTREAEVWWTYWVLHAIQKTKRTHIHTERHDNWDFTYTHWDWHPCVGMAMESWTIIKRNFHCPIPWTRSANHPFVALTTALMEVLLHNNHHFLPVRHKRKKKKTSLTTQMYQRTSNLLPLL